MRMLVVVALCLPLPALAQAPGSRLLANPPAGEGHAVLPISPGNVGVGTGPANPLDVTVPERGALPAAGSERSASPGTRIDCVRNPSNCSKPVLSLDGRPPSPGVPTQSK